MGIRPLLWTLAAMALSAATAYFVATRAAATHSHAHSHSHEESESSDPDAFHDWLHEHLEITPEQEEQLAPFEKTYALRREQLRDRVAQAGRALAAALSESGSDKAGIDAALAEIHAAQGELQRATITHFLEMKEHLSPEQAASLVQWTRESITHEHRP